MKKIILFLIMSMLLIHIAIAKDSWGFAINNWPLWWNSTTHLMNNVNVSCSNIVGASYSVCSGDGVGSGGGYNSLDNIYLNNVSGAITFNTTKNNATLDTRYYPLNSNPSSYLTASNTSFIINTINQSLIYQLKVLWENILNIPTYIINYSTLGNWSQDKNNYNNASTDYQNDTTTINEKIQEFNTSYQAQDYTNDSLSWVAIGSSNQTKSDCHNITGSNVDLCNVPASEGGNINGTTINVNRIGVNIPEPTRAITVKYNESVIFGNAMDTPIISCGNGQNWLLQTEALDNARWQKRNVTVIANTINDPSNSSVTAERIITNVTYNGEWNGMGRINQSISNTELNIWTFSFRAKTLDTTTETGIILSIGSDTTDWFGNESAINCSIDGTWTECKVTANLTAAHSYVNFNIFLYNNTNVSLAWMQADKSPISRNYYLPQTTSVSYGSETGRCAIRGTLSVSTASSLASLSASSGTFTSTVTTSSSPTISMSTIGVSLTPSTATTAASPRQNSNILQISSLAWNGTANKQFNWRTVAIAENVTLTPNGYGTTLHQYLEVPLNNWMATGNYTIFNITMTNKTKQITIFQPIANTTRISPNGSLFCCGVGNDGTYSCAIGECIY